jgi:type IV secretion system protein VirB5
MFYSLIKKFIAGSIGFILGNAFASGIPTFDGAAAANAVQQLLQMSQQIENQKQQITQLQQQLTINTGNRNLGSIMNNPLLRQYLPNDWQQVYSNMKNGKSGMSTSARALAEAAGLFNTCKDISYLPQKKACENKMGQVAQHKSNLMKALDSTQTRLNQIDNLMQQINKTQDPKAIAELQARIGIENAQIQNAATQVVIYDKIAAAEEKIASQQARSIASQRILDSAKMRTYK